jgi:hypothetical protein
VEKRSKVLRKKYDLNGNQRPKYGVWRFFSANSQTKLNAGALTLSFLEQANTFAVREQKRMVHL